MKLAAYFLAIRDDFCLGESIASLQGQGVSDITIISPDRYWTTGLPQAPEDFQALEKIAKETGATLLSVPQPPNAGEQADVAVRPLYIEAAYRNLALRLLEDADWVLTVDADEFWTNGVVDHVRDLVQNLTEPAKVFLPMTPVVAGVPVRGALDRALVATTPRTRFTWGRSADGPEVTGSMPVIHFSMTRRTLEEVIEKCRQSAHYPDPTYDFEGWIKHVLPNVRPGMCDLHMYRSEKNIWPRAGAWSNDELIALPETLRKYLYLL